jgi:ADP-ribose pyrophosphatase YjhB (NUDIX family)
MPFLGVNIAILRDDEILLTERSDFEVWCLPGGEVDPGESLAQAAVREAREETGLEVELTRLVGVYSRPLWLNGGMHVVLFTARITGGTLKVQESEVLRAGFFKRGEIPQALAFGHRQRILDALNGLGGGVAWVQAAEWPFENGLTRQELYDRQARSGLSKREFYQRFVGRPSPAGEKREVGA